MRLDSIEVQNFFNHKYNKIDLTKTGSPLLIQGENGSGKSSLINESLIFAIFGETRMTSVDDAIRIGASEMGVAIKFNLNNQDIEIMREKKRGKSAKLSLSVDGVSKDELLSETQNRINKMFGLSINSFLSSIILKQEDSDFFIKQKPDDRKKIIGEILDLNQYERLEKIARDQRSALKNEIKIEESVYNNIELKDAKVLQSQLQSLNKYIIDFGNQLDSERKELDLIKSTNALAEERLRAAKEINLRNQQLRTMVDNLTRKNVTAMSEITKVAHLLSPSNEQSNEIGQFESVVSHTEENILEAEEAVQCRVKVEVSEPKEKLAQIVNQMLRRLMDERHELAKPLQALVAEQNFAQGRLAKITSLQDPECPTCFRQITTSEHQRLVKDIESVIADLDSKISVISQPVYEIQNKIDTLEKGDVPEIANFKNRITESQSSINLEQEEIASRKASLIEMRSLLRKKIELYQQFQQAKQKSDMLTEQINENKKIIEDLNKQIQPELDTNFDFKPINLKKIQELEANHAKVLRASATIESEIEQNEIQIKRKMELENILREKIHRIGLLDKLCVAFSRKGIPASIIETVLPEIQEIANHFLARMSQNRLNIKFKTTEIQKNGNEKDTLDVEVHDGIDWRRFESFSGGEQFRISLAIRLALSKVLARRANIDLQTIVLDEPGAFLDAQGRDELVSIIMSLKKEFSRVIVMSHLELRDEFDNIVTIKKPSSNDAVLQQKELMN
jgi:exonuclease SbcC